VTRMPVAKDLTKNADVRDVLKMVRDVPDGMADLEIALMELALVQLDQHKDEIRAGAKKKLSGSKDVKKFYRALAKTRFQTGIEVPELVAKAKFITIPTYVRQDGTEVQEHQRRLPEGHSEADNKERDSIVREMEEARRYQREQEARYGLDLVDGLAEQAFKNIDNEQYRGAVASFLQESSIGKGIVAVADFFSRTGGKFQFAARAIAEFGPIAGIRIAHTYFRYGGYDVPMKEQGGKVVTEMGDTIPKTESAEATREWAVKTLSKRLPSQAADSAGAEPPSEGFIIDKAGNVLAHGVGRGNDHFLPFNSRHLRQMRGEEGVEYVRRRMFGGPTVEDLHAAMMMGAERVTVVSNGGVFTIELTQRAHGLKMEHMQVLSRYQDILDDRKTRLNFSGYDSALDALQAEFPLHFSKLNSERGSWADAHDRIGPKDRLTDQLKDALDILGGTSTTGQTRVQEVRDERGRIVLPGKRSNETSEGWFRRMSQQNPGNRQAYLQQAKAFIKSNGGDPSSVRWIKDTEDAMRRQQSQPVTRTPQNSGERWNEVTVRQADPAIKKAKAVQPSSTPTVGGKARERLEPMVRDYGLDFNNPDPKESKALMQLVGVANNDRAWDELITVRDGELRDTIQRIWHTI
jgi:hypothetical protein